MTDLMDTMGGRPDAEIPTEGLFDKILTAVDDPVALARLAYELQFRSEIAPEFKGAVIRLLAQHIAGEPVELQAPESPDWTFPTVDMYSARSERRASEVDRDWREVGLLSLSGYMVGKTRGLTQKDRRRILNWVFLEDDLRDIDDPAYASEWGDPKSSERLKKMAHSIGAFARTAANRQGDYSVAIRHWKSDLEYLRESFYEKWHEWPWPDAED